MASIKCGPPLLGDLTLAVGALLRKAHKFSSRMWISKLTLTIGELAVERKPAISVEVEKAAQSVEVRFTAE